MPYYQYKDKQLFYEDQGSGHCLFYVHEWNSSSLLFRKFYLRYLSKKVRVVCVDLPGFGNSEYVENLVFDDFSNILAGLMDHLEIKRCTLMGFCLGSAIILDFCRKCPDRVNFLILIEPILNFPKVLLPLLVPKIGVSFLRYLARNKFLFSLVGNQLIGRDKNVNSQIFRSLGRTDPEISKKYLQLLFKENKESKLLRSSLDIREKCVCILGEKSNSLFKKNAAYVKDRFRLRDSVVLDDTRHFVMLERPADVSKIVLSYLAKAES